MKTRWEYSKGQRDPVKRPDRLTRYDKSGTTVFSLRDGRDWIDTKEGEDVMDKGLIKELNEQLARLKQRENPLSPVVVASLNPVVHAFASGNPSPKCPLRKWNGRDRCPD